MKRRISIVLTSAAAVALLSSCSSKLTPLTADNFTVSPTPLEEEAGNVPFTINGRFPEKFMKKKAVVKITPAIVYGDTEARTQSATFQGEQVQGNDQQVPYKTGANFSLRGTAPFANGMQKSDLVLHFDATVKGKAVELPDVKIGYGVLSTAQLAGRTIGTTSTALSADKYQYAIKQQQQAQIKYLVRQTKVRTSELKSASVEDFVKTLRTIREDQKGFQLEGIEISSYASPEGSLKLNTELAQGRGKNSTAYVEEQLKKLELEGNIDQKYTAEDWEGFQELVSQSNIQDKDVILRVLSMYSDPEEREKQIRNLSVAFKELADEVLPELRRSRMTLNYLALGRTDAEIQQQFKDDPSKLSTDELLYATTLTSNPAEKESILTAAAKQNTSDYRALNNLGALALQKGDLDEAERYFNEAAQKAPNADEVNANRAIVTLAKAYAANTNSNYREAARDLLANAATAENYKEVLGGLNIANGQYAQAAQNLQGVKSNTAALAQILNKDYVTALQTLTAVPNADAMTYYLKAIVAARTNQNDLVTTNLKEAVSRDNSLKQQAAGDLEFAKFFENAAFQNLVK